jgi:site-specific DNA recombinase
MSRRPTSDTPFEDDDATVIPASTLDRHRSARRYQGARKSILEELRAGRTPTQDVEMVTPAVHAERQTRGLAVIYVRVSTEEQARVGGGAEGYSIPFQRDACRRKAEELNLTVVEEYVELGRSATTVNRPEFQRMFAELGAQQITHVIVHKLDRLSRSPKADYFVDSGLEATRAALVSVSEYIDDTPQGKLNLQIQRGMASYYSNNLATEVIKGLKSKLAAGGTPGRAPLGYLNKRRLEGSADIRWVEIDPERGEHVRWAFTEYAKGDMSLSILADALEDRGLRTRATPKVPSRPVTIGALHRLLVNPYFVGIVAYKGVYHQGTHEPLVDMDTWLRVQDVMTAHNTAGEKDRTHNHYLRGTIWCSHCGGRMVYSKNRGKSGGTYEYFFCMGRKDKSNPCPRPFVKLPAIEAGMNEFYRHMQIDPETGSEIRELIIAELDADTKNAAAQVAAATRTKAQLERERKKLLEAHYAGAIPLDMLKSEMDRLTRGLNATEKDLTESKETRSQLALLLDQAIKAITTCHAVYASGDARPFIRRMLNQGFFSKVYIEEDGSVSDGEIQEPFVHLLTHLQTTFYDSRKNRARFHRYDTQLREIERTGTDSYPDRTVAGILAAAEAEQSAVLLSFDPNKQNRPTLAGGPGLNDEHLAEAEGFEPPDAVRRLSLSRRVHWAALPRFLRPEY